MRDALLNLLVIVISLSYRTRFCQQCLRVPEHAVQINSHWCMLSAWAARNSRSGRGLNAL